MTTLPKSTVIPAYSLVESSQQACTTFAIEAVTGEIPRQKAHFLTPHRKDFYLFALVTSGTSRHWIDFAPYTLRPDHLYFSSPQQVQVKEQTEPMTGVMLSFTEAYLQLDEHRAWRKLPIIRNASNAYELKLSPENRLFLDDLLGNMLLEASADQQWQNTMLQSYVNVFLIYLSRLYTDQFPSRPVLADRELLQKFRGCIDLHYHTLHHVADYADLLYLTPGHLNERIKQQSGKTAIEHIHERLVMEARRQLLHTDLSAKEIAWQLGFEDVSYFHRFFKRLAGQTPAAYRTAIREMYQ